MKGISMEKFKLPETINAERIVLIRRNHEHDKQIWQAIEESRQFVREFLFWVDNQKCFEDTVKATDQFAKEWDEDKEWAYDIFTIADFKFVGCVGPHNIEFINQSAELGYWLRLSETRKGYMHEAVLALEKELFKAGMHRITICCDVNNMNSANVAKKAGYTLESVAKEATYHYTGLKDKATYVKFSPYPIKGFEVK